MHGAKHGVKQLTVIDGSDQVFSSQIATSAGQILTPRMIFFYYYLFIYLFLRLRAYGTLFIQ